MSLLPEMRSGLEIIKGKSIFELRDFQRYLVTTEVVILLIDYVDGVVE